MRMEVIEVSKVIRKHTVLDRVSCSMHSGKIYGIQGINGSGKTMLMRVLIGLIHPSSGKVLIDGKELGKELEFPKSIGFLLENPTFLDRYSGYQNLKMLASVKKIISDEEINKVLCLVGLDEEAAKKKYRKYSLGMKQRLGIAAALMEKPDIVILDEPTNALDTSGVELVKEIVRGEKKRGCPRKILSLVRLPFRHTCLPKKHFYFFLLSCCLNTMYITICHYEMQVFFEIFSIFLTIATVHPNEHLRTQR